MKRHSISLLLMPAIAGAQSPAAILPDRPSFSDGQYVVPKGHWQLEAGATVNTVHGDTTTTWGELLVRFPLTARAELRFSNVTFTHVHPHVEGLQDPSIGVKFRVMDGTRKRVDLAGELQTTVPAGGADFRVNRAQPTAKLLWYQDIDGATGIGGNLVASDLGPSEARFTQWAESLYVSRTVNARLGLFAEVFRLDPVQLNGVPASFWDAGVTLLLNPRTQIDSRLGAGFDARRDGQTFGAGVAYRF